MSRKLDRETLAKLADVVRRRGVKGAVEATGIPRTTLYYALDGGAVREGTRLAIEVGLVVEEVGQ